MAQGAIVIRKRNERIGGQELRWDPREGRKIEAHRWVFGCHFGSTCYCLGMSFISARCKFLMVFADYHQPQREHCYHWSFPQGASSRELEGPRDLQEDHPWNHWKDRTSRPEQAPCNQEVQINPLHRIFCCFINFTSSSLKYNKHEDYVSSVQNVASSK